MPLRPRVLSRGATVLCVGVASVLAACSTGDAPRRPDAGDAAAPPPDVLTLDAAVDLPAADGTVDAPAADAPIADVSDVSDVASSDVATPDVATPDAAPVGGWVLRWSDEFDGPEGAGVDATKWAYDTGGGGWGNGELEHYTARAANVARRGGYLEITALREDYEGSRYTSGRIKTAGRFEFRYGRVEMRARLPQGQGIWPAFWMLGADIGSVPWPACGEIDIMEWVGRSPTRIFGTVHGPSYSGEGGLGAWHTEPGGYADAFHSYAVEWEPDVIRWYFDGGLYEVRTPLDLAGRRWAFDHDFFILLNLAVGGAWPGAPDATTTFPQRYQIDYVRVYQRPAPAGGAARTVVSLRSSLSARYVSADGYDADRLGANRAAPSTWEFFETQDLGGGRVALRALQNYKLVSAGETGADPLTASAESVGPGETFTLTVSPDGTRALRCAANGRYVSVVAGSPNHLVATAMTVGAAESFTLTTAR